MKKLAYEIPEFELALVEEDINTMTEISWDDGIEETLPPI